MSAFRDIAREAAEKARRRKAEDAARREAEASGRPRGPPDDAEQPDAKNVLALRPAVMVGGPTAAAPKARGTKPPTGSMR